MNEGKDRLKLGKHIGTLYSFQHVCLYGISDYLRNRPNRRRWMTDEELWRLHIHGAIWVSPEASAPTCIFRRQPHEAQMIDIISWDYFPDQIILKLNGPFYPVRYSFTDRIFIYLYDGEVPLVFGSINLNKPQICKPIRLKFVGKQASITSAFTVFSASVPANLTITITDGDNLEQDQNDLVLYKGSVRCSYKINGTETSHDLMLLETDSSGVEAHPKQPVPLDRSVVVVPVDGESSLTIETAIRRWSGSSLSRRDFYAGNAEFKFTRDHYYKKPYSMTLCEDKVTVTITCEDNYAIDCGRQMRAKAQARGQEKGTEQIVEDFFCPLVRNDSDEADEVVSPPCLEMKFVRVEKSRIYSSENGSQFFGEIKFMSKFRSKPICLYARQRDEAYTIDANTNEYLTLAVDRERCPLIPYDEHGSVFVCLYDAATGEPFTIGEIRDVPSDIIYFSDERQFSSTSLVSNCGITNFCFSRVLGFSLAPSTIVGLELGFQLCYGEVAVAALVDESIKVRLCGSGTVGKEKVLVSAEKTGQFADIIPYSIPVITSRVYNTKSSPLTRWVVGHDYSAGSFIVQVNFRLVMEHGSQGYSVDRVLSTSNDSDFLTSMDNDFSKRGLSISKDNSFPNTIDRGFSTSTDSGFSRSTCFSTSTSSGFSKSTGFSTSTSTDGGFSTSTDGGFSNTTESDFSKSMDIDFSNTTDGYFSNTMDFDFLESMDSSGLSKSMSGVKLHDHDLRTLETLEGRVEFNLDADGKLDCPISMFLSGQKKCAELKITVYNVWRLNNI